jgi:hypothetical protein
MKQITVEVQASRAWLVADGCRGLCRYHSSASPCQQHSHAIGNSGIKRTCNSLQTIIMFTIFMMFALDKEA